MRTHQDIFDYCVKKLAEQGGPSRTEACRYRDHTGRKCAFGWFIPNEKYSNSLEGLGVISLFNKREDGTRRFDPKDVVDNDLVEDFDLFLSLFSLLQAAHDSAEYTILLSTGKAWRREWRREWIEPYGIACKMAEVAKRFELNDDVVAEMWPKDHGVVVA